ncbi:MAG: zinc ABC transporter ATP-binding protein ZnuC [Alphaproteobacteria bacterium]|nr:MAG: zinc ABC transporter ATP-binding protein ZnuC [Alphaproteobacteria bacterium]
MPPASCNQLTSPAVTVLLRLQNVSKRFADQTVVDRVSLEVERGEVVSLMGPNGAGKSTLLKIALGLESADTGSVTSPTGTVIGYMPQKVVIDPLFPLTVERFIRLRPGVSRQAALAAADRVGVGGLLHHPAARLSGGETQRVLLARAIARRPDLLVLDEPVQGVDVNGQVELYRLIAALKKEFDCGVLMVSHDLHLVMAATDRVICLNRHVCCSGEPHSIAADPAYQAMFGDGSAQFALYAHAHDHSHAVGGDIIQDGSGRGGSA